MQIFLLQEPSTHGVVSDLVHRNLDAVRTAVGSDGIELIHRELGAAPEPKSSAPRAGLVRRSQAADVNDAVRALQADPPDFTMFLASDHLVSASAVSEAIRVAAAGAACVASGPRRWLRADTLHCVQARIASPDGDSDAFRLLSSELLSRAGWQPMSWSDPRPLIQALDASMSAFAPDALRGRMVLEGPRDGALGVFARRSRDWWALAAGARRIDPREALGALLPEREATAMLEALRPAGPLSGGAISTSTRSTALARA